MINNINYSQMKAGIILVFRSRVNYWVAISNCNCNSILKHTQGAFVVTLACYGAL